MVHFDCFICDNSPIYIMKQLCYMISAINISKSFNLSTYYIPVRIYNLIFQYATLKYI